MTRLIASFVSRSLMTDHLNFCVMQNEIESLLKSFFYSSRNQMWAGCETIIEQCRQSPVHSLWGDYLASILINERDKNPERAEEILRNLLQQAQDPLLLSRANRALVIMRVRVGALDEALTLLIQGNTRLSQDNPLEIGRNLSQQVVIYSRGFDIGLYNEQQLSKAVEAANQGFAILATVPETDETLRLRSELLHNLSLVYKNLGQFDQALAHGQEKIALCERRQDRRGKGLGLGNMGEIYQAMGAAFAPLALYCYGKAREILDTSGEWQREVVEVWASLASLHHEMGKKSDALYAYGQAIDGIEALRIKITGNEGRIGFFSTVVSIYEMAVLLCYEMGRFAEAFEFAERARARTFLEMANPEEREPLTLAMVQARLSADAVVVSYYTGGVVLADKVRPLPNVRRHRFPKDKTLIFVVTREHFQVMDADLQANLFGSRPDPRQLLVNSALRLLYDQLVAPIWPVLQEKKRLYLIPHGPLHAVPFVALLGEDGRPLLDVAELEIFYAPSASLLLQKQLGVGRAPLSCLAVGYNDEVGEERPLRYAEMSASTIAALLAGEVLVGSALKKAWFLAHAGQYRLLHFAGHGLFVEDEPVKSALLLAPGESLTAVEVEQKLTLQSDLVVLSACQTGRTRLYYGDELNGFVRAFMIAGATALLTTQWPVHDNSTMLLMTHFYGQLEAGVAPVAALKLAQRYVRQLTLAEVRPLLPDLDLTGLNLADDHWPFADPVHWAPFTLTVRSQWLGH